MRMITHSPTAPPFTPSPQQHAVMDFVLHGEGSAFVEAVAGSGKTTTLLEALRFMLQRDPRATIALLAFNKKIATELEERVAQRGLPRGSVNAGTFHSFGFKSLMRSTTKRFKVEDRKIDSILHEQRVAEGLRTFVTKAVSIAKQRGLGAVVESSEEAWQDLILHFDLEALLPAGTLEEAMKVTLATLATSNDQALTSGVIDFDDMLYLPLLWDTPFEEHSWVLIDEAQDTNPVRRAIAEKLLAPGGRVLAVGDRGQAIYGFTGADNNAIDTIVRTFDCVSLPLTVTYRCPRRVVAHAQKWVSHIEAADSAPEGVVRSMPLDAFRKLRETDLRRGDVVLCRNTAPLVREAFRLIRAGIGCHVEGRDIGKGLIALTNKWRTTPTVDSFLDRLEEWSNKEITKLLGKRQESKAEQVQDRLDTMRVLAEALPAEATLTDLRVAINNLFEDTVGAQRRLTLSTIHKAKGREWDRVYLLGRDKYMPSKFAKQAWQMQQEINLIYVAVTRAKQELVEVNVGEAPPQPKLPEPDLDEEVDAAFERLLKPEPTRE